MSSGEVIRPFRWDITRRSHLGSLPEIELPEPYEEFEGDLLTCCARVLAFADDGDLLFVGRSPQPLFDYLSGLLLDTSWSDRLRLLNVSLRGVDPPTEEQLRAFRRYLAEVALEPSALARRPRTVALVDVVETGGTLGALLGFLKDWSDEVAIEWRAVRRKIRIVGLTSRTKTSPKTWRWQQHAEWVERLRPHEIKNVSIPGRLWIYLARDAPTMSYPFMPQLWDKEFVTRPMRDLEARVAVAYAVRLFDLGRMSETRRQFAAALARHPMTDRWFRSLILELKR